MFKNKMNDVIQSNIARGIFSNKAVKAATTFTGRVTKAALAEAETGGLQQIAEMGYKDVWNNMNNKDMFEQPELWTKEFWGTVGHAAAAEAVGGFVMGVPGAVIAAAKNKTPACTLYFGPRGPSGVRAMDSFLRSSLRILRVAADEPFEVEPRTLRLPNS